MNYDEMCVMKQPKNKIEVIGGHGQTVEYRFIEYSAQVITYVSPKLHFATRFSRFIVQKSSRECIFVLRYIFEIDQLIEIPNKIGTMMQIEPHRRILNLPSRFCR